MKRSVYVIGISCAILMLFGCIAKVMHWPGAGPMIIASVFLFCFWFLPAGLVNSYNSLPFKKMKPLHIVSFIVFSFCMMGVLFKIMHWPGASMFLLPGIMLPFVVFLPVYLYYTREEEKTGNKNFFALTLGLTFLAVFSVFLALSTSKQIVFYSTAAVNYNEASTNVISAGQKDSEVSKAAKDLFAYTDELKCELLSGNDPSMCDGNKPNANYTAENISNINNKDAIRHNLAGTEPSFLSEEGTPKLKLLKGKINTFRETVLASQNISAELAELTKILFDTSDNDVNGIYHPGIPWERREFDNYPLIFTLDFLSKLQSNVRLVEGEALR
jgi:hypothetical protein